MNGEETLVEQEGIYKDRHGMVARGISAVLCGILAGILIPNAMEVGFLYNFPQEKEQEMWGLFLWGEHWALRVTTGWASAIGAGFITGIVARKKAVILAGIAAMSTALCWLLIALIGWGAQIQSVTGSMLGLVLFAPVRDFDISLGNKLAATALLLTVIPLAMFGGVSGENVGRKLGRHFDLRRYTLLGIKWYHFFWLPILIHVGLAQASWVALYGFEWLKLMWKAGVGFGSMIPTLFALMIWGTLLIMGKGASRCYLVLAGLETIPFPGARALAILKYGFGALILAAVLQAGIQLLHYGLTRLF